MAIMTCKNCQIVFEGRPNRRYCSIQCRRAAEMAQREIKKEERYQEWLAALSPEERDWLNSIPTIEELCPELETFEIFIPDLPGLKK